MAQEPSEGVDFVKLEAWCRQASAGDADALSRVLAAHRGRLAGYVHRKIGPDWRGKIEDDDVLQEAYIEVFQTIGSFTCHDVDSFYRWATRIIDHKFIDQVRRLRRKKRDAGREVAPRGGPSRHESFLANHFADTTTASKLMRREDAVSALMACIAKLPPDYLTVVRRYHLDQEPLADIAADIGRSPDAVRRLASRAVEQLQTCLRSASRFLSGGDI